MREKIFKSFGGGGNSYGFNVELVKLNTVFIFRHGGKWKSIFFSNLDNIFLTLNYIYIFYLSLKQVKP